MYSCSCSDIFFCQNSKSQAKLFAPPSLLPGQNGFCFQEKQSWVAGSVTTCSDLNFLKQFLNDENTDRA